MIEVKELVKKYRSGDEEITATNNVTFTFQDKGFYIVLGKSGCGKTTLLNILAGLNGFDSGEVLVDKTDISGFNESQFDAYRNIRIGIIFQQYNLLPDMNVYDNLRLVLEMQEWDIPLSQRQAYIDEKIACILSQVGLSGFEKRRVNQLSGGEQQRIAIARTLLKNPDILFADEPTGNLDQKTGNAILDLLKSLSKNCLVIMVSHDRESAFKYGDYIINMSDGAISSIDKLENGRYTYSFSLAQDNEVKDFSSLSLSDVGKEVEKVLSACENGSVIEISKISKALVSDTDSVHETGNDRKNIKTKKLANRYKLQLAFGFLQKRRIRLLFTIVLTSLTIVLLFFSMYISFYNKEEVIVGYMEEHSPEILPVYTTASYMDDFFIERNNNLKSGYHYGSVTKNAFMDVSEIGRYLLEQSICNEDDDSFESATVFFLDDMEAINLPIEGHKPTSTKEIVLTDFIAGKLNLKIGDVVEYNGCCFALSGIIQTDYLEYRLERKINLGYSDEFFLFKCSYTYFAAYLLTDVLHDIKMTKDILTLESADFLSVSQESKYLSSYVSVGSQSNITKEDLILGRMPEKADEVVVSRIYLEEHSLQSESVLDKHYSFKDINEEKYKYYYSDKLNLFDYYPQGLTIVGVIEDENDGITKDVYMDDGIWNQVLSDYYLKYTGSYALFPTSGEYKKLVSLSRENNIFFDEPAVNNIYFFDKTIKSLKPILLVILMIIMAINFIMVGTFVNISISENRRNIGILRSLGVPMKECTHIFNYEFYAIYVGSILFATIMNFLFVCKVNEFFSKGLKDVRYDIITFNLLIYSIVALLEFLISYISVKIPIRKLSRQKPLEILADSDPS